MTPAIESARAAGISFDVLTYDASASEAGWGMEAAVKLGLDASAVFKTLVVDTGNGLAVVMLPVDTQLSLKAAARALSVKRVSMASPALVEKTTGYVLGGVSPLGQRKQLPAVLDSGAMAHARVYVSAGRRGLEIVLAPDDLARLTGAILAPVTA